jgi:hypothetical protein
MATGKEIRAKLKEEARKEQVKKYGKKAKKENRCAWNYER